MTEPETTAELTVHQRYHYQREGKTQVKLAGLVDLLCRAGYRRCEVQLIIWPGMVEDQPTLCVVKTTIELLSGQVTEGLGEASAINTIATASGKYMIGMAKARSLADAIGRAFNVDDDLTEMDEARPSVHVASRPAVPPPTRPPLAEGYPPFPVARAAVPAQQPPSRPAAPPQQPPPQSENYGPMVSAASDKQIGAIYAIGKSLGWSRSDVEEWLEVNQFGPMDAMTKAAASNAIQALQGATPT